MKVQCWMYHLGSYRQNDVRLTVALIKSNYWDELCISCAVHNLQHALLSWFPVPRQPRVATGDGLGGRLSVLHWKLTHSLREWATTTKATSKTKQLSWWTRQNLKGYRSCLNIASSCKFTLFWRLQRKFNVPVWSLSCTQVESSSHSNIN